RYQSASDLRADLKRITRASASVVGPTARSSHPVSRATLDQMRSPRRVAVLASLAGVLVVAAIAVAAWTLMPHARRASGRSIADLQIVPVTSTGHADRPVISSDGRYVAYIERGVAGDSLWIRDISTSASAKIVTTEPGAPLIAATFTPDGRYVTFSRMPRSSWGLARVPFLGGSAVRLFSGDVGSAVGWSGDGRHMAFVRSPDSGMTELVVAEADGQGARTLAARQQRQQFLSVRNGPFPLAYPPSWAPDGRTIAAAAQATSDRNEVALVDASNGTTRSVAVDGQAQGVAWLDNDALLLSARIAPSILSQIWSVDRSTGHLSRLTNDLSEYIGVSTSASRHVLATARRQRRAALWSSEGAGGAGKEFAVIDEPFTRTRAWAGKQVLFSTGDTGELSIVRFDLDTNTSQRIVNSHDPSAVSATSDGRTIVFAGLSGGLWRADGDGQN